MGKSFYDTCENARTLFKEIDEILEFSISDMCFNGPDEALKNTRNQQLAILAVSLAAFEVFKEKTRLEVSYLSGLSLGEYTCLYAGGVLTLSEVVRLVNVRAQAMEEAAKINPSTMFAVLGWDRAQLEEKKELGFYLANMNAPTQIAISVGIEKKEQVKNALSGAGAKVIELSVSGGFHSPFMEPAKAQLSQTIASLDFKDATIPIVSNVTARAHTDSREIKENLITQLVAPDRKSVV